MFNFVFFGNHYVQNNYESVLCGCGVYGKAKVKAGVLLAQRWILAVLRHQIFYSLPELNEEIQKHINQVRYLNARSSFRALRIFQKTPAGLA